jgi:hypothetical protein
MIEKQDYLTVKEISQLTGIQIRTVIQKLKKLMEKDQTLVYKNSKGIWQIHISLESKFKRIKRTKDKWWCFSIDAGESHYSLDEINQIMEIIFQDIHTEGIEMNYLLKKTPNLQTHIEGYSNTRSRTKLLKALETRFPLCTVGVEGLPNLRGWINNEGSSIICLNKQNEK